MSSATGPDWDEITGRLRRQACEDAIRITIHGHQEMVADDITYAALREALQNCRLIENYPDHQRGACCLVCGSTDTGRHLHIVCTTSLEIIIVITAYEPTPPKWVTPFLRGAK